MDTVELLNQVAKHLAGYEVLVKIQEPAGGRALGECWWEVTSQTPDNEPAVKIAISPRAVFDGDEYLKVFLHEVAHAKLHSTFEVLKNPAGKRQGGMKGYDDPDTAWKLEGEAMRLSARWVHYAKTHYGPFLNSSSGNPATREMQARLMALLYSPEAATWTA